MRIIAEPPERVNGIPARRTAQVRNAEFGVRSGRMESRWDAGRRRSWKTARPGVYIPRPRGTHRPRESGYDEHGTFRRCTRQSRALPAPGGTDNAASSRRCPCLRRPRTRRRPEARRQRSDVSSQPSGNTTTSGRCSGVLGTGHVRGTAFRNLRFSFCILHFAFSPLLVPGLRLGTHHPPGSACLRIRLGRARGFPSRSAASPQYGYQI